MEINTTDNGSVVFILVNFVGNGDRFLVTVNVVAVGELTIACYGIIGHHYLPC
jgi:hypothetical protein